MCVPRGNGEASLSEFQSLLDTFVPGTVIKGQAHWLSAFSLHRRLVDTYGTPSNSKGGQADGLCSLCAVVCGCLLVICGVMCVWLCVYGDGWLLLCV